MDIVCQSFFYFISYNNGIDIECYNQLMISILLSCIIDFSLQKIYQWLFFLTFLYSKINSEYFWPSNFQIFKLKIIRFINFMIEITEVIKSPNDKREYKAFKLQNGLQCLIIKDVDALKSSAALSMAVGSFKDPNNAQGLAHYLQHMLFMGTAKYPDENDYSKFITKYGGKNNAFTSQEQTNYMLEVSSSAFQGALDRFAQFFISPLLKQESAEKQIEAVHSQHQKNLLDDNWRKYQLQKHISKEGHPFNKFSTGDKSTLHNQNLQQMLQKFYQENYSSNLMKLAVYGQQDIATMQKWVVQKFSEISNKNKQKFKLQSQPFDNKAFGKLFKVVPIKESKKLTFSWVLPNKRQHYRNHPGTYISNLIGHEGKGSILSYLMKEGLATSVSSGNYDNYDTYTELSVDVGLTDKGLTKIHEIICYFLYYIEMLKQKGCPEWFFKQLQLVKKLKFEFMETKKGMSFISGIAKVMQSRKLQQTLIYPYLMEEWKPELISQYLNELTTANLIVFCEAKEFQSECILVEPIYKTKYSCEQMKQLIPLQCDVSIPEQNIFLPKDLTILPLKQEKLPVLIHKSSYCETFFKQDHVFGLPKAIIHLRIMFNGNFSVTEDIDRTILLDMLKEELRQFRYLAEMAEIQVQTSFVSYFSLDIKFTGFRDSLRLFVVQYLKRMFEFVPTDVNLFNTLKQKYQRKYKNVFLTDAYNLAYQKSVQSLRSQYSVSDEQKLVEIQNISFEEVVRFSKVWKKRLFFQSYFSGNISEELSKQISLSLEKFLSTHSKPHKKQQTGQIRAVRLQCKENVAVELKLHNKQQQNSALQVHYQIGQLSIRNDILLALWELIVKEPTFDYLRTKQKLGYIVFCMAQDNRGVGGLSIIVQSSIKSSYELATYVKIMTEIKFKQILDALNEQQFESYKNGLKATREQKDKNLAAQATRYWGEIVKHKYNFNKKKEELQIIPQITLNQLKKFVESHFFEHPCRFELHITSFKKQELNSQVKVQRFQSDKNLVVFESIESFNRKCYLYPDFYAPNI